VEKGDKRFNSPKSSKVKKVFLLLNKAVRLNFSSYKCKLLKFSLTALITSESTFLTFDLLGLLKRLSPFCTEPFNCERGCTWYSIQGIKPRIFVLSMVKLVNSFTAFEKSEIAGYSVHMLNGISTL